MREEPTNVYNAYSAHSGLAWCWVWATSPNPKLGSAERQRALTSNLLDADVTSKEV